jgi:hypothetical protein
LSPRRRHPTNRFWCGLIVLTIQLAFAAAVFGVPPEVIPFSALGYSRAIVLKGVNPEFALSIPAPAGGLDPAQSFVQVQLNPSPALHDDSTVRLILNGEPIKIMTVKSLRINPLVKASLPPLPPGEAFIHFAIQSYLYISQNYCHDLSTGNLFLTVDQHSFFHITPRHAEQSIVDFFRPFYREMALVVPAHLDPQQTEATLWLYSILSYHLRDRQIPIIWQYGEQAPSIPTPRVIVDSGNEGLDVERDELQLRVRATSDAVQALLAALETPSALPGYQPALVGRGLAVESIAAPAFKSAAERRTFRELGFDDRTVQGPGTHILRLSFSLAQLGGRPQDLAVVLKATFTPVASAYGDRLQAQVYFNSALVKTYDLTDRTSLRETVFLPSSHLQRANNLDILFSHMPAAGNCQAGLSGFIAQVQGDSFLTWAGSQGPSGDFDDLPHRFLGDGQVIAEAGRPASVAGAGYLLGVISRLGRQPVLPEYLAAEEIEDWATLPAKRTKAPPTWRLIAASPARASLPAPVRLGQGFEIYNPLSQRRLLQARPSEPIGLLQYFILRSVPTLWLSWWGEEDSLAASLAFALADPRTSLAGQLKGNVVTAVDAASDGRGGTAPMPAPAEHAMPTGSRAVRVQSWDLSGSTLHVAYSDDMAWEMLLRRYRSLIVALVAILGGCLTWLLYRRFGRRPVLAAPDPKAPQQEGRR